MANTNIPSKHYRSFNYLGKKFHQPLLHEVTEQDFPEFYRSLKSLKFLEPADTDYNGLFEAEWLIPWGGADELAMGRFRVLGDAEVAEVTKKGVLVRAKVFGACFTGEDFSTVSEDCVAEELYGEEADDHYCGTALYGVMALLPASNSNEVTAVHSSLQGDVDDFMENVEEAVTDEALERSWLDQPVQRVTNPATGVEHRLILWSVED